LTLEDIDITSTPLGEMSLQVFLFSGPTLNDLSNVTDWCFQLDLRGFDCAMNVIDEATASLVDLAANHDCPGHPGHLVGHGDTRHAHRFPREECDKPEVRSFWFVFGSADQRCRADHNKLSRIPVTHRSGAPQIDCII
jgi:hypothetical protein